MTSLILRSALFALMCGIIGYMLFVIIMWFIALGQVGAWVFTLVAGGGASG
jgi:hypothetical protein